MAAILEFGPFRLDADAGILFRGAEPTPLGRRAVLLLALLVRRAGMPVSKDALIEAAWPAQMIEDSNLTVQIAAVRRTLADASAEAQWIETLPRRGYRYVGPAVTASDTDRSSAPSLTLPDKPSIAVLPFANLGCDAEQDYFADGMVDDIITGLSRINWLFVIARNSTFTYKGRAVDVKQVGRELGVRYLLEGSVRRTDGNARITGQLIDASTGMHVWAERYDRQSADIFALQDDIAMSVVGAITPSLRRAEINRVKRKRPDSLDAYDLVLRAQPDVDSGMPEQVTQALVLLERAIALEPSYALAHGNAAMCHHCLFLRAGLREASRADSIRHARSAVAHGQDDALALTLAGFSIGMDGHDRSAAFTALDAALAISPSSALTYILGSVMLGWGGDADRRHRMEPARHAAQPVRLLGLRRLRRAGDGAFPPRPVRAGLSRRLPRRSGQSPPQHHPRATGRGARKARPIAGGENGRGPGAGVTPDLPLRPSVPGRQLRSGVGSVAW